MEKMYVLFNPLSGNGKNANLEQNIRTKYPEIDFTFEDITIVSNYDELFRKIGNLPIVLCGGDGTINKFINYSKHISYNNEIYYYPCGTGNDFARDIGAVNEELVNITKYLTNLPTVIVKGNEYKFINNVGFGIDGYCCEVADNIRETNSNKAINYTGIAVKGLLFHYKKTKATVVVDGKEEQYKKVWLATTLNSKYYGGAMKAAPNQNREADKVTLLVYHVGSKLRALMNFPSIIKGTHVKKPKMSRLVEGKEIKVIFDSPRAVQVDGETILDVTEYIVRK